MMGYNILQFFTLSWVSLLERNNNLFRGKLLNIRIKRFNELSYDTSKNKISSWKDS